MTILIIENNPGIRLIIRNFVRQLDSDPKEYNDAGEALRFGIRQPPEWVLFNLDITDPLGVDGIARIKSNWNSSKIVALATYDEIELRTAAFEAGAHAYILKDDLSELCSLLRREKPAPNNQ